MKKKEITFEQAFDIINGRLKTIKTDVIDRGLYESLDESVTKRYADSLEKALGIKVNGISSFDDKRNRPAQLITLEELNNFDGSKYFVLRTESEDILASYDLRDAKCFVIESDGETCLQIETPDKKKCWSGSIRFYPSYETVIKNLC